MMQARVQLQVQVQVLAALLAAWLVSLSIPPLAAVVPKAALPPGGGAQALELVLAQALVVSAAPMRSRV